MSLFSAFKYRPKGFFCLCLSLLAAGSAQGDEIDLDLYLTNGYRQDEISADVHSFDPADTLVFKDALKTGPLRMYQVGMKGYYSLCNFRVRGDGSCAWSTHGHYTETFGPRPGNNDFKATADIKSAKATTFTLGGGYLLPLTECFGIIPMAGVSYNSQVFKIKSSRIGSIPDRDLDGLRYVNRWRSPWVGADLVMRFCQLKIQGGYEYHFGRWNAKWELAQSPSDAGFSDHRHSNNAYGQVGYLDAHWMFSNCIEMGFGVKYQYWHITKGKLRPLHGSLADNGISPTEVDRVKAKWQSFSATFDIGCHF